MSDRTTTVDRLKEAVQQFARERDWGKFHNPKNLSMGLAAEAAELMEHFLWVDGEESHLVKEDAAKLGEVADEMADVACYLLTMSYTLGIDLSDAIRAKIAKNAVKYPADKCRGDHTVRNE
ncbi:MAG: NTP pyrophosphohydrolase [Gemmatales bacterium]|nr:MAG: NTP pyrophosphohydrolase [Gemmatales bacterium]